MEKGGGNEGGDHAPRALAYMGKRIAHEVDAAALPACGQHLRDRSLGPPGRKSTMRSVDGRGSVTQFEIWKFMNSWTDVFAVLR